MMKRNSIYIIISIVFIGMISCSKSNDFPTRPYLEYESIYVPSGRDLNTSDTVAITCTFKDKEGDLQGKGRLFYRAVNLTTTTNTTEFEDYRHPMPDFPEQNKVEGELIVILSPDFDFSVGAALGGGADSIYFELFLKDKAGHFSDTVRTDTVRIESI